MPSIHPIQPILVVVLATVLWYIKRKPKGDRPTLGPGARPRPKKEKPEVVEHQRLRQAALQTKPEALGLAVVPGPHEVYGVLMEMEIAGSVVTLACFANGDASLSYQSAGGGMPGGRVSPEVRKAAKGLVSLGQRALSGMVPASSQPLPGRGKIRFYAITPRGIHTVETDREAIGQPGNDLSALFYSGQEVVSQMREAEAKQADG